MNEKLSLYNYPSSNTKSIVEWVALYKGNKPQDWTAPPEEQVTTDEFTQKTTEITKVWMELKKQLQKWKIIKMGLINVLL